MIGSYKYLAIVAWAKKQIAAGAFAPGKKFLSEAELCEAFRVSRQTVRRALDVLAQGGYITRIQGSGTYVAGERPISRYRADESGPSSMTIGIITTQLDDYIFPGITRGIEGVLSAKGFFVQLVSTKNVVSGETRALRQMLESPVAGLIVEPTKSGLPCHNLGLYQAILQKGIPLIFTDSRFAELSHVPCVSLDDEQVGYQATTHLLDMGHRRIAGIFSHTNRPGHGRYVGYARALAERGIPLQDDLVHWYSYENYRQIIRGQQLLECLNRCSAVLCYNDQLALMLVEIYRENGRLVPEDLSIVGIDNSELAKFAALTSVIHPGDRLGEAAASLLISMLGGAEGRDILFQPELVVRGSVQRMEEGS